MPARVIRNAVQAIALLAAVVSHRPVFAQGEGGSPAVTAESSVVLWGSETEASGAHLSAVTFELPVGTKCHVAEPHAFAPLWSCALGEATVSGYARRAAFTKQGLRRLQPKSAFWKRLQRYSGEWAKCTRPNAPSEDCGRMLALRLNLFWAARLIEVPKVDLEAHSTGRTLQCSPNPSNPECVGNACEAECFSRHLGEGRLMGGVEGAVFLQQAGKDTLRMFAATAHPWEGLANKWVAPPMTLFDPMLVSLLRGVKHPESLAIAVDLGREQKTFLETQKPASSFRTPLRLDGHHPFVVCDGEIVRPPLGWPERIGFEEVVLPDLIVPIYQYLLPCSSSLVIGEGVSGIHVGEKAANPLGTPPKMTPGPDGKSLSVGPLTLRGEPAPEPGRLKRCTLELEGVSEGRYRSCRAVYAGDLNGDGKEDFVLDLRGESGCGGATLFLSTRVGWKKAAENSDYC
jgi:hypothetical protein